MAEPMPIRPQAAATEPAKRQLARALVGALSRRWADRQGTPPAPAYNPGHAGAGTRQPER